MTWTFNNSCVKRLLYHWVNSPKKAGWGFAPQSFGHEPNMLPLH